MGEEGPSISVLRHWHWQNWVLVTGTSASQRQCQVLSSQGRAQAQAQVLQAPLKEQCCHHLAAPIDYCLVSMAHRVNLSLACAASSTNSLSCNPEHYASQHTHPRNSTFGFTLSATNRLHPSAPTSHWQRQLPDLTTNTPAHGSVPLYRGHPECLTADCRRRLVRGHNHDQPTGRIIADGVAPVRLGLVVGRQLGAAA